MAKYNLFFTRSAEKSLKKLSKAIIPKMLAAISGLAFDPCPQGCRKLTGYQNLFRIRIQNYRMIYEVLDDEIIIKLLKIGHRKDVCQK